MAEYIECKAAINRIKEYALEVYGIDLDDAKQFAGGSSVEKYSEGLYEATELVDDIQSADVAPVVHGRWVTPHWHNSDYCYNCSKCGGEAMHRECQWARNGIYPICPNCGAIMDGGDDDATY